MSGSGQSNQDSGFMQAMSDPTVQKYLVNMGTGMAGGRTLADSLAGGLQMAGQGLIQDMDKEQRKKLVKDVLGSTDLSSLDPIAVQQKGLELIGSGDPSLAAIGQHLVTTAISKQPSAEWQPSEQVVGGKNIAGQRNIKTGEFKPFSADLMYGPKVTYVPELQTFVDQYGNPATPSSQQGQAPVSGLTDTSIGQAPTQPTRNIPGIPVVGGVGMTPKARQDLAIWGAQQQVQQGQEIAKEQRGVEVGKQKILAEESAKKTIEANDYFSPAKQQEISNTRLATKGYLSDLNNQITQAHTGYGTDLRPLQNIKGNIGFESVSQLEATAKTLLESKIREMRSAGVMSAGQLNSDMDVQNLSKSIFDPFASEAVQRTQLKRLNEDFAAADKQIMAKEKSLNPYVTKKIAPNGDTYEKVNGRWILSQ